MSTQPLAAIVKSVLSGDTVRPLPSPPHALCPCHAASLLTLP